MTTTTNYYQVNKHLFEPFPNDSTTCRFCQRSFSDSLHANVPTQPPDITFEYCPTCGGDLDTGWECNKCGRDWRSWATLQLNVMETETEQ
jgi:hypothetical protein